MNKWEDWALFTPENLLKSDRNVSLKLNTSIIEQYQTDFVVTSSKVFFKLLR